jgi:hypothetical protein
LVAHEEGGSIMADPSDWAVAAAEKRKAALAAEKRAADEKSQAAAEEQTREQTYENGADEWWRTMMSEMKAGVDRYNEAVKDSLGPLVTAHDLPGHGHSLVIEHGGKYPASLVCRFIKTAHMVEAEYTLRLPNGQPTHFYRDFRVYVDLGQFIVSVHALRGDKPYLLSALPPVGSTVRIASEVAGFFLSSLR